MRSDISPVQISAREEGVLAFDTKIFSVSTVKKALYRLADRCSFDLALADNELMVTLHPSASSTVSLHDLVAAVRTEVIDQDLRDAISQETQSVRTLILANAFSNTNLIEK